MKIVFLSKIFQEFVKIFYSTIIKLHMSASLNQPILDFLEEVAKTYDFVMLNDENEMFLYCKFGMTVFFKGNQNICQIEFQKPSKERHRNTQTISYSLPFSEIKPLLDKFHKKYQSDKNSSYLQEPLVLKTLEEFKNFLKNEDWPLEHDLSKTIFYSYHPITKKENILRIGRLFHTEEMGPREINFLSLIEIPLTLQMDDGTYRQLNWVIPGWEIGQYKIFDNLIRIKKDTSNLNEFAHELRNINHDAGLQFHHHLLDETLPEKNNTCLNKLKI